MYLKLVVHCVMFYSYIMGWDQIGSKIPMSGTFRTTSCCKVSRRRRRNSVASSPYIYIHMHTQWPHFHQLIRASFSYSWCGLHPPQASHKDLFGRKLVAAQFGCFYLQLSLFSSSLNLRLRSMGIHQVLGAWSQKLGMWSWLQIGSSIKSQLSIVQDSLSLFL